MHTLTQLDAFTRQYIETALWSSTDDAGVPLDGEFSADDIAPDAMAAILEDCKAFQEANAEDIGLDVERAGQDFWLTRNRHGAGFWDGDWPSDAAKRLTEDSHAYGECLLYVGSDGMVYLF